jgi:hypothetical protein
MPHGVSELNIIFNFIGKDPNHIIFHPSREAIASTEDRLLVLFFFARPHVFWSIIMASDPTSHVLTLYSLDNESVV